MQEPWVLLPIYALLIVLCAGKTLSAVPKVLLRLSARGGQAVIDVENFMGDIEAAPQIRDALFIFCVYLTP
jgi:hypothetical protein